MPAPLCLGAGGSGEDGLETWWIRLLGALAGDPWKLSAGETESGLHGEMWMRPGLCKAGSSHSQSMDMRAEADTYCLNQGPVGLALVRLGQWTLPPQQQRKSKMSLLILELLLLSGEGLEGWK